MKDIASRMADLPYMEHFLDQYGSEEELPEWASVFEMLEELAIKKEIRNTLLDQLVEPDRYGCWATFVCTFITEEMRESFSAAARVFLRHESDRLDNYTKTMYADPYPGQEVFRTRFNMQVLSMMVHAVQEGSAFTADLLILLYKTFFKKEYKTLRRFRKINYNEIRSFIDDCPAEYLEIPMLARIMGMCMIMDISFDPDCCILFTALNDYIDWKETREDELADFYKIPDKLLEQGEAWVKEQIEQIDTPVRKKKYYFAPADAKEYLPYRVASRIAEKELSRHGFDTEYLYMIGDNPLPVETEMGQVYAMLAETFPEETFSFRDVQMLTVIQEITRSICAYEEEIIDLTDTLLYTFSESDEHEDWILTNDILSELKKGTDKRTAKSGMTDAKKSGKAFPEQGEHVSKTEAVGTASVEAGGTAADGPEELIREISRLRELLHATRENEKRERHAAAALRREQEEQKKLTAEYASQKKELAALREYVYQLTEQEDVPRDDVSLEEMKERLSEKHIVIIGGHSNWSKKLKQEFPAWTFLNPKASGSVDKKLVLNADKVYFFTDAIAHTTYYRFVNIIRESKVDFGYIHSTNIERNVRQIYRDF